MCSFCFHGFEMVTVIERDGDRRQVEQIQMPGKDCWWGGLKASDSGKHSTDVAEEMFRERAQNQHAHPSEPLVRRRSAW